MPLHLANVCEAGLTQCSMHTSAYFSADFVLCLLLRCVTVLYVKSLNAVCKVALEASKAFRSQKLLSSYCIAACLC